MKISYISRAEIPSKTANSIHIVKMCNALAAEHNVTLYADFKKKEYKDIQEFYGLQNKFALEHLKAYKIKYFSHFEGLLIALLVVFRESEAVLGRHVAGCFFTSLFGLQTVFESHAPIRDSGKLTEYLFRRLIKSRSFKNLIVITYSLKNYYIKAYPELKGKITVLPDGADEIDLSHTRSIGIRKTKKLNVGYTGHLYQGKGMEIIGELVIKCKFAHFHIVGGKDKDVKYWENILNGQGNITFYGFQKHSVIPSFLKDFDVVLLPNQLEVRSNNKMYIGQWTSPLKLFEYMATGKAIIASDISVLKEVLVNGTNAILCNPNIIEPWVDALSFFHKNPNEAKRIGKKAKAIFKENYEWKTRAWKAVNIYQYKNCQNGE